MPRARLKSARRSPAQFLYVIVFSFRYLDIFWNFLSVYNTIMKIIFIASSVSIVCVMKFGTPHKDTYNREDDAFPIAYLIAPALILGIAINQDHESPFEMCARPLFFELTPSDRWAPCLNPSLAMLRTN